MKRDTEEEKKRVLERLRELSEKRPNVYFMVGELRVPGRIVYKIGNIEQDGTLLPEKRVREYLDELIKEDSVEFVDIFYLSKPRKAYRLRI